MNRRSSFIIIVLLLLALIYTNVSSCEAPLDAPQQSISYDYANTLEEEFKRTRSLVIDSSLGYEDTREFWFSLDTLKNYFNYVEQQAKEQKITDLGIRIYFAAYPNDNQSADPGFSTVVLVPTTRNENLIKRGFFPIDPEDANIETIEALNFGHGGKPPKDL